MDLSAALPSHFSLCAMPLESSGPGFRGVEQRLGERAEVWEVYRTGDVGEDLRVKGGVKDVKLIGDEVANGLGLGGVT